MFRELLEHVIKKTDAGRNLGGTSAIEIHSAVNARFLGIAFDARYPRHVHLCVVALRQLSFNNFRERVPQIARGLSLA
jgi:hypothetical protein